MYARVTTVQSPPDRLDDVTQHIRENLLPQLQQQDGFKGFIGLGDRQSGKVLGVVLWESEEALRASDEAASRLRSGAAEATGSSVADVDRYEVTLLEVSS